MGNDKTNMFVAIGLSLLVLLGWQYFVAGPRVEQQRQIEAQNKAAQQQQQPPGVTPDGVPSPSPKEGGPGRARARHRARPGRPGRPRGGARPLAAHPHRHAGARRLDRAQGRPHRRRVAQELPRDRRSEVARRSCCSRRPAARRPTTPSSAGSAPAGPLPDADTVWTADGADADARQARDADLGQRRRASSSGASIAVDDKFMFTVQRQVENKGSAPATLYPYGLVSRHGKPPTQGYYVLHEGLIGVVGDQGLQEYTYDSARQGGAYRRASTTRGKVWNGVDRRLPRHHRQVLGRGRRSPTRTQPYQGALHVAPGRRGLHLPGERARRRRRPSRPAPRARRPSASSPAPRRSRRSTPTRTTLGIKKFDLLIDWGWFYFITKPMFKALDFFFQLFGNFGVSILIVTLILKAASSCRSPTSPTSPWPR